MVGRTSSSSGGRCSAAELPVQGLAALGLVALAWSGCPAGSGSEDVRREDAAEIDVEVPPDRGDDAGTESPSEAFEATDAPDSGPDGHVDVDGDAVPDDAVEPDVDTADRTDVTDAADVLPEPAAACRDSGVGGHLQLSLAYWAGTAAYGDHLGEPAGVLGAGHVDLARLAEPLPDGIDVVVDLHWNLFDYERHTVRADLSSQLDAVAAAAAGKLHRVRAFYLIDEPYIAGHEIRREELELAIAAVEARFPGIPTYITFAHHCFDPASTDAACVVPPDGRGVPAGLDWAAFDWYNDSNDPAEAARHVGRSVTPGVARLAELAPGTAVLVVPEAYTDRTRLESTVVLTLYDYFDLAVSDARVFGVDFFLWADAASEGFHGLTSRASARAAVRGFARLIRRDCGYPVDLVPVTQWYRGDAPDYRYEAWHWSGAAAGYIPHGVAFALPPEGTPGTVPLYHCLLDRGGVVDSYLTLDAGCDGVPVVSPAVTAGGIFTGDHPGTLPLRRYTLDRSPWDHVFTIDTAPLLPSGYAYDFSIGGVYPPSAV